MKKLLVALSLLTIISITGCRGQAQANYGDTEDYESPNVTRILDPNNHVGYNYLIDNNTGVVYLEYEGLNGGRAITVMFDKDGTLMTEKDIKK